jgi:hypothetical protein
MKKTQSVYLIHLPSSGNIFDGALFHADGDSTSEDYNYLRQDFFSKVKGTKLIYPLDSPYIAKFTSHDIVCHVPYTYSLTPNGIDANLYFFDCHSTEQEEKAEEKLRKDQDVVFLVQLRINLVNYDFNYPFESASIPESWINPHDR